MTANNAAAHAIARATKNITKGFGAQLAGKKRGPDHGEGRRVPHRNSFDVDSIEATENWHRVGDGSIRQGIVYSEALIATAQEQYAKGAADFPRARLREAERQRRTLEAELERAKADPSAAPGLAASIRQELAPIERFLAAAEWRLRRTDMDVLAALLSGICYRTGRLFPSHETIAAKAVCSRNAVIAALRRLKRLGFLTWTRRTVKTGNEGEFAPQREQTSNAYHFDHRRAMPPRTWQRYWQLLCVKLKRLGAVPPGIATSVVAGPSPALRDALAALEAKLDNAST